MEEVLTGVSDMLARWGLSFYEFICHVSLVFVSMSAVWQARRMEKYTELYHLHTYVGDIALWKNIKIDRLLGFTVC